MAINNPLISVGQLNRLVATVTWQGFPQLNVIPSFMNREMIRLAIDGEATRFLPAATAAVTSPEPYQMVTLTINLLKTQGLATLYKAQYETSTLLGDCVVRPDVVNGLPPYDLTNMAIEGIREMSFAGEDAGWAVVCRGSYLINADLWNS